MLQVEELPSETASRRADLVKDVCCCIRDNPASKITLADLGRRFGVSPYYLQRTFVDVMGYRRAGISRSVGWPSSSSGSPEGSPSWAP